MPTRSFDTTEVQTLEPFLATPLANSILRDPSYTVHALGNPNSGLNPNRNLISNSIDPITSKEEQEVDVNPFFRITSHSGTAVLQTVFLTGRLKEGQTQVSEAKTKIEGHLLLRVGRGITGQTGIAHGGFLATVMDEVCGNLVAAANLDEGLGMFTARLSLGYKRPVLVPEDESGTVIVASARVERVEGRKVFIEGIVRDGNGVVCTTAEAIFVKKRALPATL
ncbi:HotDog domain-containing protein [Aspergillus spinulosporus]